MTWKNTADRWGPVSQSLHWLIVLLVLMLAVVGLSLDSLPKTPKYFWVYTMHKSVGITVLALVLARIGQPRPAAKWLSRYLAARPEDPQRADLEELLSVLA